MHIIKRTAAFATLLAGVIGFAGQTIAAEKLNLAIVQAAQSLPGLAMAKFAEETKKASGGEIEIVVHAGAALGYKERDEYYAVQDGAVAIGAAPFDKLVGLQPVYEMQSLPFLTPTIKSTKTMWGVAQPHFEKAFNKDNMTLLFGAPFTPQGIWAKIKIRKPEDLAGLKIRTYDVTGLKVLKAAGAAPIQMSWADVVPALSTNVIEGVLTSDESGCNGKFWEYGVKYFNSLGYTMGIAATFMNLDKYNSFSPEMQKAIRAGAKAAEDWAWANTNDRVAFNVERMKKGGGVRLDDVPASVIDHLKKAGAPLLGEWKKKMGPDADVILAEFNKRMGN